MVNGGFMTGFYRFGEIVMSLFYLNLLWIVFTLTGGILLGFGPSTVALYTVLRRWMMGEGDRPVFQLFWRAYRLNFLKANGLTFVLIVLGSMLYINIQYFELSVLWLQTMMRISIFVAVLLYG